MVEGIHQLAFSISAGRPDVARAVLALVYLAAAVSAMRVRRASDVFSSSRRVWLGLALGLLALGLADCAGVFESVTSTVRGLARAEGWYEDRWQVQLEALGAVVVVSVVGMRLLRAALAGAAGAARTALLLVALMVFLLIRAVSLHEIDAVLRWRPFAMVSLNRLIECGLLAMMLVDMRRVRLRLLRGGVDADVATVDAGVGGLPPFMQADGPDADRMVAGLPPFVPVDDPPLAASLPPRASHRGSLRAF